MRRTSRVLAAAIGLIATATAHAQDRIEIPTLATAGDPATLIAFLTRPAGTGPFPAIVMLHGCGGAYNARGDLNLRQKQWERAFLAAGYLVLQLDSFTTRGIKEVCTLRDRPVSPTGGRRRDALAALAWLQARREVMGDRVALAGWSNGASTAVAAMERRNGDPPGSRFRAAIAFYPGCRSAGVLYRPAGPLLILTGELDNWTPPGPCLAMIDQARAQGEDVAMHVYAGAYHDFDWPKLRLRTRSGLPLVSGGTVTVGVNEAARADALLRVPEFLARWLGR